MSFSNITYLCDHFTGALSLQSLLIEVELSKHPAFEAQKIKNEEIIRSISRKLDDMGITEENAVFILFGSYQFYVAKTDGKDKSDIEGIVFLKEHVDPSTKHGIFQDLHQFLAGSIECNIGIYSTEDLRDTLNTVQDAERITDILVNFFGGRIVFGSIPKDYIRYLPDNSELVKDLSIALGEKRDYRKNIINKYRSRLDLELQHGTEAK